MPEATENTNEIQESVPQQLQPPKPAPTREPSAIFVMLSNIMFVALLAMLAMTVITGVFTLDFLDIWTFRYSIPESWRTSWPLSSYYDFVQRHQLPEEQRYHEMMLEMKKKMDNEIVQGNKDLAARAKQLEDSYNALIKAQREKFSKEYDNLKMKIDEYKADREKLDKEIASFTIKQAKNEELAKRLASETANVEASLIRFMENQNRLDQVCSIAAQMEPKSLANIFNEMSDDQLIYDIMGGLEPRHSAKVLAGMDAEKAGKVMAMGNNTPVLPQGNAVPSYVPPGLKNLLDETRENAQ